jgi:hypothetical protein
VKFATEEPLPDIPEVTPILPLKENLRLIFSKKRLTDRRKKFVPAVSVL